MPKLSPGDAAPNFSGTLTDGSKWKDGPREVILACIDSYATIVIEADETTVDGLRDRLKANS